MGAPVLWVLSGWFGSDVFDGSVKDGGELLQGQGGVDRWSLDEGREARQEGFGEFV